MNAKYKFSGHETFSWRYAWLPKAIAAIQKSPRTLYDEDTAMVELGVGKNMVRAIRFWAEATSIAKNFGSKGWKVTSFGDDLLGENGLDTYLEDNQTLWLLHWKLATQYACPLFAWDYLLCQWHEPEFTRSSALRAFEQEVKRQGISLSPTTLAHHLDVFIHTYIPTRGRKNEVREDNLDCPLVELRLLLRVGDSIPDEGSGRREPIYAFRHEQKPEISSKLFIFCLADFLIRKHPQDLSVSFREVCLGQGSPGQIFKLPEANIRDRLQTMEFQTKGIITFDDSTSVQLVKRKYELPIGSMLKSIYTRETAYA